MANKDRGIFRMIFNNFLNSIKPRQFNGKLVGKDSFGNSYYETLPDRRIRKTSRYFVPLQKDAFDQEMPAEWEAWLRGRRNTVPSEEEVLKNAAISILKKKNAAEIELKEPTGEPKPIKEGSAPFPSYDEYEKIPGLKKS